MKTSSYSGRVGGLWIARGRRQREVTEGERRQLGPPAHAGLAIERDGVLTHGSFTPVGGGGDLLVTLPLEEEQRALPLRRGKLPLPELLAHRPGQPLKC